MPTPEWHLRRDPDELPFCAGPQRNALSHKWILRSSRLKTYALSAEEIESCQCKRVLRVCWDVVPVLKERPHASAFCIGCTIEIITLISEGNQNNRTLWLREHSLLNWGSENFLLFWMETISKALQSYGLLWHLKSTYWWIPIPLKASPPSYCFFLPGSWSVMFFSSVYSTLLTLNDGGLL